MSPDPQYVTWDRWDEAHKRLAERIGAAVNVERLARQAADDRLAERAKDIEGRCQNLENQRDRKRDLVRALITAAALAFLTGLVLPLLVIALSSHMSG